MTAPALPRDDQHTEQVFDLALEQMLDGDVTCRCGTPATWLATLRPCNHLFPLCDEHAAVGERVWSESLTDTTLYASCNTCDQHVTGREVRPI